MVRLGLGLIWLLRLLPLPLLAGLGRGLGRLLYVLAAERRNVVLTNLSLCFPELDRVARRELAKRHFASFGRTVLEHGILWWSSKARVERLVRIEGIENWQRVSDRPVILLAPHFLGLDMGGVRLNTEHKLVSVYSRQKNPVFDAVLYHGRTRFEPVDLYSRQQGIRPVIKSMRKGWSFYYLPDMDLGERDSVFVPFFGTPAATVTGLSRIARLARAVVVPCVTRQLPGGGGYVLTLYPAWDDFPSEDVVADTRRMNAFIEDRIREMPEQYYWLHRRFKTRPEGQPSLYDGAA